MMKFNIEIELEPEEIKFFKKFFHNKKIPNTILWKMYNKEKDYLGQLENKCIIRIDSINNCHLTKIGQEILEQISRESIIDKLI